MMTGTLYTAKRDASSRVCLFVCRQTLTTSDNRSVSQDLPTPDGAWLLGNRSLTPVASGRPLVYQVT